MYIYSFWGWSKGIDISNIGLSNFYLRKGDEEEFVLEDPKSS
jgi:hypothetical protein